MHSRTGKRVNLHRAISKLGWGSRTQAWDWIRAGEVRVDGRVVLDPLAWVDLEQQKIEWIGQSPEVAAAITIAFHKPRGIVTTHRDERGRRTVYDLLPSDLPWVFPVGRLDADSEGLLILTNDSALSVRLTEPSHRVPKTYHVTIRGIPTPDTFQQLREGVRLNDGTTRPARIDLLRVNGSEAVVSMILTEGRNRQIRRMCSAMGHRVRRLVRVAIGAYTLGQLPPGEHRLLTKADIRLVTRLV